MAKTTEWIDTRGYSQTKSSMYKMALEDLFKENGYIPGAFSLYYNDFKKSQE